MGVGRTGRTVTLSVATGIVILVALAGIAVAPTAAAGSNASDDVYIHPEAENAGGEVTVLLELESPNSEHPGDIRQFRATRIDSQTESVEELRERPGVEVLRQFWITNAILVRIATDETSVSELADIKAVEEIYLNFETKASKPVATDGVVDLKARNSNEDGLDQVHAREAWADFDTKGENVTVAVLDTGVDTSHPDIDLAEDGWAEFDASGERLNTDPRDPSGHGTHVTSVAAGGNASGRYLGVAPEVALLHGKVLDDGGTFAQIIAGIEWALKRDADVVSMSFGIPANDDSVYEEAFIEPIRTASEAGTVVVTSSGNTGQGATGSPGNVYDAVAVGAVNDDGEVPSFSSGETVVTNAAWGEDAPESWPATFIVPDVTAPGTDVVGASPGGGYTAVSGTSTAAPYASGTVALMLSANGDLSRAEAKSTLRRSAVHPDPSREEDDRYGTGLVDAHRAVTTSTYDTAVTGTVETATGSPAVDVPVRTEHGTTDRTDSEGRFSIPVPPGARNVTAAPFGYNTSSATVEVTPGDPADVELVVSEAVDVRVTSGPPDVVAAGDTFEVELAVANLESYTVDIDADRSDLTGDEVTIEVNGETVTPGEAVTFENDAPGTVTLSVSVAGNATGRLTLTQTFEDSGETALSKNESIEVLSDPQPADVRIVETEFGETVGADRTLRTGAVVKNVGDYTETRSVAYRVEIAGTQQSFYRDVTLEGGETAEVSWVVSFDEFEGGEYDHRLETGDDTAAATYEYLASEFVVAGITAPKSVTAGETATISVAVENIGDIGGEGTVELAVEGDVTAAKSVDSAPGERTDVTFDFGTTSRSLGRYDYAAVVDSDAKRDDIVVTEPPLTVYATEDGTVNSVGLNRAVEDWRRGRLTTKTLRDIIKAWRTKDAVE